MVRLIALVKELSSFLDSQGRACCFAKAEADRVGAVTDLDGEVTSALLSYRYYEKHKEVPNRSDVRQALNLVLGELWSKRPASQAKNPVWAATVRAIVRSVGRKGDFVGSAEVALKTLKDEVLKEPKEPAVHADLPKSSDQMGVVLVRIGLLLRGHNIELFRPPRRERERLWCWRELTPDHDTSDTADTRRQEESGSTAGQNQGENHRNDTPDTLAEEENILVEYLTGARR